MFEQLSIPGEGWFIQMGHAKVTDPFLWQRTERTTTFQLPKMDSPYDNGVLIPEKKKKKNEEKQAYLAWPTTQSKRSFFHKQ